MSEPRCERGSALIVALFTLTLLTGMGVSLLFLSQHEARMSRASLREKKAFYLAEAGLEHARRVLFVTDPTGSWDDELAAVAGADLAIDFDPTAVAASYGTDGEVLGFAGYGDDVPLASYASLNSADSQGWYVAFLTNDPAEGPSTLIDGNERVMITAVGAGEDSSLEIVQAIVEPSRVLPAPPAAAITMLGPLPAFYDNGNSNAQTHTGNDCGVSGGAFAPIVGTVSQASKEQVQDSMNKPENFSAGPPPEFEGEETVADLTSMTDPIVAASGHGIIDPLWTDCESLKQLVIELEAQADHYCNAAVSACTLPVTSSPDTIVFIDGDLASTPNGSYAGTLVVTGQLSYSGHSSWNGIVMVIGEGRVIRSGGGGGMPSGAMIIANIDPSPNGPPPDRSDWCTSASAVGGFDQSFYDTSGGGNSTVQWCSTALESANAIQTYRISQFLQR